MKILVTGGAGYIGSHMVKVLKKAGHEVLIFDNLSAGHFDLVCPKFVAEEHFFIGDLLKPDDLQKVFRAHEIGAVMHFAAKASVPESMQKPLDYYLHNVQATLNLLQAMHKHKVGIFIFSSTAAVYGQAGSQALVEDTICRPINPYGRTKLIAEEMLADLDRAGVLRFISLRYFNAAGADPDGETGEWHDDEHHLIPRVLQAAAKAEKSGAPAVVPVYGNRFATLDGTCVRDYVHVMDLAKAHLLALEHLQNNGKSGIYNLGNERGYSVMEIIAEATKVTGIAIQPEVAEPRPGDPAILIASPRKAQRELHWKANFPEINQIIQTAWNWEQHKRKFYDK